MRGNGGGVADGGCREVLHGNVEGLIVGQRGEGGVVGDFELRIGLIVLLAGLGEDTALFVEAVLFFIDSPFVTGVCLPVDGGRTIFAPDSL